MDSCDPGLNPHPRSAKISQATDAVNAIAPIFAITIPTASVVLPVIFSCAVAKWAYNKYKSTYVISLHALSPCHAHTVSYELCQPYPTVGSRSMPF